MTIPTAVVPEQEWNSQRSYFTTSRAAGELGSVWALLDITPFGRQEEWQDAPEGVRRIPPAHGRAGTTSTCRTSSPWV